MDLAAVDRWLQTDPDELQHRDIEQEYLTAVSIVGNLRAEVEQLEAKNAEGWVEVARLNLKLSDARTEANRLRAQMATVLDRYSNDEPLEECEPEDVWRLFRDLRAALASDEASA